MGNVAVGWWVLRVLLRLFAPLDAARTAVAAPVAKSAVPTNAFFTFSFFRFSFYIVFVSFKHVEWGLTRSTWRLGNDLLAIAIGDFAGRPVPRIAPLATARGRTTACMTGREFSKKCNYRTVHFVNYLA